MRNVLYIAMSLDGYIADKNGGVNWLNGDGSDDNNAESYPKFIETIDTIIVGYKTYNQLITELSPDKWVYQGKKTYVITHKKLESRDGIIFTNKELENLISEIKKEEGKDIWICGGASIVNQFLKLDLIDRFCITIIPTILGEGIRLFSEHKNEIKLKLISTYSYNGMTDLIYERRVCTQL